MKTLNPMQKLALFLVSTIFLCVCSSGMSEAAEIALGKIDLRVLYAKSVRIQAIFQELEKTRLDSVAQVQRLASEYEAIENRLKAEKDKLKVEERQKLEHELKAKQDDLRAEQEAARVKVSLKRKSAENSIMMEAKEVVARIAKLEGLKVIIAEGSLIYAEGIPDITDKVMKALDAEFSADKKKGAPAAGQPSEGSKR